MADPDGKLIRFGQRLREVRLARVSNQDDFARLGGVKKNSQVLYESGRSAPSIDYLYRLAEHGIDIGYVLTGRHAAQDEGAEDRLLLDMFASMSAREREAVVTMMRILTGGAATDDSIRPSGSTLHSRQHGYRPSEERG